MKLTVKNIGVIREAEIALDGITVLGGYNGTGKSTISKALYGMLSAYAISPIRIAVERRRSIQRLLPNFLNDNDISG